MKIENDVVFSLADCPRRCELFCKSLSGSDDAIEILVTFKKRSDPILKQNIDFGIRKEPLQCC